MEQIVEIQRCQSSAVLSRSAVQIKTALTLASPRGTYVQPISWA